MREKIREKIWTLHTDKDSHSVVTQEWTPRTLIRFSALRNMVGEVFVFNIPCRCHPPPLTSDTLPIYPTHELFILILCLVL
jgi:hypothetical protein